MKTILNDKTISAAYAEYRKRIGDRVQFFKDSDEYIMRGSGDTNLWKLFLERAYKLAAEGGSFAMVIPSGIVTDEGGRQLRETLFKGRIKAMFEFENKKNIFPSIDSRTKFVLLVFDKTAPTESFPGAFYLHDISALDGKTEQEKFVEIPIELVKTSAPESLSIPEVKSKKTLEIFSKIYKNYPLLSNEKNGWSITLLYDLHRTHDGGLMHSESKGWPLIDGKNFHQFISDFEKPTYFVNPEEGLKIASKRREYLGTHTFIHNTYRLVFRGIASSTNVRTVVACILPPHCFGSHATIVVMPRRNGEAIIGDEYLRKIAYLAAIFNSFVFDFLVRLRVTMNLSYFFIFQTPIPKDTESQIAKEIIKISCRLNSIDERFANLASSIGTQSGAISLGERINLTAQLNALVATHFGLTHTELELILKSFEGLEEDKDLKNSTETKWDDRIIRRFNGEVQKRVLSYFDEQVTNKMEAKLV
jgi:hypothetical protein